MIEGALEQMIVDMLSEIDKDIHNNLVEQMKINPEAIEALYE
jgi:hypothetical protein